MARDHTRRQARQHAAAAHLTLSAADGWLLELPPGRYEITNAGTLDSRLMRLGAEVRLTLTQRAALRRLAPVF